MEPMASFIQYRISTFFMVLMLLHLLPLNYSKRKSIGIGIFCFVSTGILDHYYFFADIGREYYGLITMCEIVIVQSCALILSRYRDFRTLFIGFSTSVFVLAGNIAFILSYIYLENIYIAIAIEIAINVVLLVVMIIQIRGMLFGFFEEKISGWPALCLIPALYYIIVSVLAAWPNNLGDSINDIIAVILILIHIPISYLLIIRMLQQIIDKNALKRDNDLLGTYTNRLKYESQNMINNEIKTATMRHDMRHVATMIESFLEAGNQDEVKRILSDLNSRLDSLKEEHFCANIAIDGIVRSCLVLASKEGVDLKSNIELPRNLDINEFEFATVVSNLLENAVYAAAKVKDADKKKVYIKCGIYKKQMTMMITNTFEIMPVIDEKTGFPLGKVQDGHGFGLRSVKVFVDKHNAIFEYSVENNLVVARMTFKYE